MGGNALKGFVERKNKEEHQKVVDKVLSFLHKFTDVAVNCKTAIFVLREE